MSAALQLFFSRKFEGIVWKTLIDPDHPRIFVEERDPVLKKTFFSGFDLVSGKWIIDRLTLEEPWWLSMQAVSENVILLTHYSDTQNPDKKSLVAFDMNSGAVLWWKNNFVMNALSGGRIAGTDTKFGSKELMIDLSDGREVTMAGEEFGMEQNFNVIRPFQYQEGTAHFETVRAFLQLKCQISPTTSIEYCEYRSLILISAFAGPGDLANYLFVFNSSGDLLLSETLGEDLKGIALDTFFIFTGFLIFVKNKRELVSYRFV